MDTDKILMELIERVSALESNEKTLFRLIDKIQDQQEVIVDMNINLSTLVKDVEKILDMTIAEKERNDRQDEDIAELKAQPAKRDASRWDALVHAGIGAGIVEFLQYVNGLGGK